MRVNYNCKCGSSWLLEFGFDTNGSGGLCAELFTIVDESKPQDEWERDVSFCPTCNTQFTFHFSVEVSQSETNSYSEAFVSGIAEEKGPSDIELLTKAYELACEEAADHQCPNEIYGEDPFPECEGCCPSNLDATEGRYDPSRDIACWKRYYLEKAKTAIEEDAGKP